MQLVEQHCIDKQDLRYNVIDEAAFKSKNLYNAGNYEVRQSYIQGCVPQLQRHAMAYAVA